ncbi:MAG TPA: hypothetical protein PLI95_17720, partial [Polyangiaceae bacterium]|nr:hypothetical protein [Polyangiaceae bacterium]
GARIPATNNIHQESFIVHSSVGLEDSPARPGSADAGSSFSSHSRASSGRTIIIVLREALP